MPARTDVAAAPNARVTTSVVYDPDPRGAATFGALVRSVVAGLRSDTFTGPNNWHGNAVSPQRYAGAAGLAAAVHSGTVIAPRSSTIDQEREANPSIAAAMRLFAQDLQT